MVRKSKALNEIGVAGSFPNCARRKSYKKENASKLVLFTTTFLHEKAREILPEARKYYHYKAKFSVAVVQFPRRFLEILHLKGNKCLIFNPNP